MPSRHDPLDCLADILENVERIEAYVAGLDRNAFERDGRTRDAVERCLERICEAAFRLGDAAPKLVPDQPWPDIRGLGNRLRHAYDRINLDVIWNAVRSEVPKLAADVRLALQRLQHDSGRSEI
ncbi:MAG: DUF86 domain-containing protein [Alphaproteobacteria bacterium]|nr:DUF86 domain-containing protein [Alphaproteobacteria bacterium]